MAMHPSFLPAQYNKMVLCQETIAAIRITTVIIVLAVTVHGV